MKENRKDLVKAVEKAKEFFAGRENAVACADELFEVQDVLNTRVTGVTCDLDGSCIYVPLYFGNQEVSMSVDILYMWRTDLFGVRCMIADAGGTMEEEDWYMKWNAQKITIEELFDCMIAALSEEQKIKGFDYERH